MDSPNPLLLLLGIAALVPGVVLPAIRGAKYGASDEFSWVGAFVRAVGWSVAASWTIVICVGHGAAAIPAPTWFALAASLVIGRAPCAAIPPAWISIGVSILTFLVVALQYRGRAIKAPWA